MKLHRCLPLSAAVLALASVAPRLAFAQDSFPAAYEPPPPPPDEDVDLDAPPPPAAEPPQAPPDQRTFDQQLAPYGRWVVTPEYGRVWVPAGVGPDWQPYADGQWVSTTWGWSFVAPVPWGWAVYHYGRWGWRVGIGWFWLPGYVWGPAWVSWRWVHGYACWSPLAPPGFHYGRHWPGWVVVPHAHFAHPIRQWAVPRAQVGVIVRSARPVHSFPTFHARAFKAGPGHAFRRGGHGRH